MSIGRRHFLLETGGHCFICLRRDSWSPDGQNMPKITSLQNIICQYLKLDLREAIRETVSETVDSIPMLELGDSEELMGSLCHTCSQLSERFSAYFLELEGIRMKLQFCLKMVHDRMGEEVDDNRSEEFKREMLSRPETLAQLGIVEHLRRETLERSSVKLAVAAPQVEIEKLADAVLLVATSRFKVEDSSAQDIMFMSDANDEEDAPSQTTSTDEELSNASSFVDCDIDMTEGGIEVGEEKLIPGTGSLSAQFGNPNGLQCQFCGKTFSKIPNLKVHLKTIHLQIREYGCDLCESRFTQKAHLAKHKRAMHFAKSSKTNRDGPRSRPPTQASSPAKRKVTKKVVSLPSTSTPEVEQEQSHCSFNEDTGLYRCRLCQADFRRKSIFTAHYISAHIKNLQTNDANSGNRAPKEGIRLDMESPSQSSSENAAGSYKKLTLGGPKSLIAKAGKDRLAPKPDVKLLYRCLLCDQGFAEEHSLKRHFNMAHLKSVNSLSCGQCDKEFTSAYNLQSHINTFHLELRQFECHFCEKRFKQKAHMEKHVRLLHISKKRSKTSILSRPKSKSKKGESILISSILKNFQNATGQDSEEDHSPSSSGAPTGLSVGVVEPPTINVTEPLYSDHGHLSSPQFTNHPLLNQNELQSMGRTSGKQDSDEEGDEHEAINHCETTTIYEPKQESSTFPGDMQNMG